MKTYQVFNIFQTGGLGEAFYEVPETLELNDFQKDEGAEKLIFSTDAKIEIKESRAFYNATSDSITLPLQGQFHGTEPFYGTALHELAHWTDNSKRLDRKMSGFFGSPDYAKEELIAEQSSAYLCASLGFIKTISNNAAYLKSWLSSLKENSKLIFTASSHAQKAAD